MQFFNNLKLSTKLVGGFGIVLFIFLSVMVIYYITVKSTSSNFENLMNVNVAISSDAAEIKTLMKQCRIDEKNFLSTLDTKYLKELEDDIKLLTLKAQSTVQKARDSHDSITAKKAEDISKYIDSYAKLFNELSKSYEIRGLDVKSGLRGEFATAADRFVLEMAYVDVEDLYVHMLRIVQAQNEYWSDDSKSYLNKIEVLLEQYKQVIESSNANEGLIKDILKDALAAYHESLKKLKASENFESGSQYFKEMQSAIAEIDEVFNVTYLPNAKPMILEIRGREKDYLLFGGSVYAEKAHQSIANLFTAIEKSNISEDYKKNSVKYLNAYKKAFDNLIAEDVKIAELYAKMSSAVNSTEPIIEDLYQNAKIVAEKGTQDVIEKGIKSSKIAMAIGFGAIIFGFCLSFFITKMVTVPITKAVQFSRKMSQGDFTKPLDINQRDEIGILASALNEIITNIGGVVKDIGNDVTVLSSSSVYLKDISLDMSQRANNTALKFNTVAAATEENTVTISEIAKNSDKARTISNEAVELAQNTSVDIKRLEDAARDIGKVTETIADISSQTNLLALNATIEAARAGESGKGFAVVANEIKELANQTAAATKEISSQIASVQNTAGNTIEGIEKITSIINQVNDIISAITLTIEDQTTATQEISSNVAQGSQGIQEVAENVAQCSLVASEISGDIAGVNQDAAQISENSCNLNGSAENLSKIAENLKLMMKKFRV